MNLAIMDLYSNGANASIPKITIKALNSRSLLTIDGSLSPSGKRYVLSKMPLLKQCIELSLEYQSISLTYDGKPEPVLLKYYESLGYLGSYSEGIAIFTVLKALMLDELQKYSSREQACTGYLDGQLFVLKDKIDEIIFSISKVNKKTFLLNFSDIICQPSTQMDKCPELSIDFANAIFDAIETNLFIKLATRIAQDPYTLRNGWPDLTLVKGDQVRFIEVKTTDKLHCSQLVTIPIMRKILPFQFSVCKVKKLQ